MFFDNILENSKHILNYSSIKSQSISSNIANINNPEYKRKYLSDISFEDTLNADLIKKTNEKHLDSNYKSNNIEVFVDMSRGRNDNNNVNLDTEIINLTKTNYLFKAASEVVSSQYKMISDSLT